MRNQVLRLSSPLLLAAILAVSGCGGNKPFSAPEWKSLMSSEKKGSDLVGMAKTLVSGRVLIGMSREEVVKLLGEGVAPRGTGGVSRDINWVIDEYPVLMSFEVLEVRFDASGKAIEALIVTKNA